MKPTARLLSAALSFFVVSLAHAAPPVATGEFTRIKITDEFWAEGASFGDFNRDGKMDVVYGPFWWEGPGFTKRHEVQHIDKSFTVKQPDGAEKTIQGFKGMLSDENEYSKNFLAFTHDIDGDGWTDIVILGFPGAESWWFENPKGGAEWKQHVALEVTDNESPAFGDITGDGRPEIVCMSGGYLGFAEYDPKHPAEKWKWHRISPLVMGAGKDGKPAPAFFRFTHGLGVGDVNGDGRMDILETYGWWEQPASLAGDPVWKKHEAVFGEGGAQMFAYDVNGDGKADVITSLQAHGYGLAWFEQTAEGWIKHLIVGGKPEDNVQGIKFSQPHALDLVDMNGDGLKDIVTGKRFWAHGPKGDVEPEAAPVTYWFELRRTAGKVEWLGHLIDDATGVGTQVVAGDINGDGKPDVLVGNKRGATVLLRK